MTDPKTLQDAIVFFASPDNCVAYLVARRWPNGVACPTCGRTDVTYVPSRRVWQCRTRHPKAQFSIKVGTIFEDSPISLDKWLLAMWMLSNCKNGVSSYEISRAIKVTQKSCWFMLQRIRLALQDDLTGGNLSGEVEVDETYIGGKARNMHHARKRRLQRNAGRNCGKTVVLGILERGGNVRANVVPDRTKDSIAPLVRGNVEPGTQVFSDENGEYWRMDDAYTHGIVSHLDTYVNGNIHTNGIENFWSLLKRTIGGTYVSVEPFHLFRYVDEQAFRFNNRATRDNPMNDGDRFSLLCEQIVGKRLTYAELTAKEDKKPEAAF